MPAPSAQQLDTVIGAVTQVFVLSLAVERICALLKHMKFGFWGPSRTALKKTNGKENIAIDRRRDVNSINSLLVGMAVAGVTHSNAFGALTHATATGFAAWAQIAMTGAAAGVGSSFWYDLISLLITVRQAKQDVASAQKTSAEQVAAAAGQGPQALVKGLRQGQLPAQPG